MVGLSIIWAFPLPFRDFVGIPTFFTLLTATHVWTLRSRLRHYYRKMIRYIPLVCAQASTLFIFQGLEILFANVPQEAQGVITVTFPLLRAFMKRMIWTFTDCLDDISTDVTVCVVEIFGSLFQNVCVQNARSPAIGALIIIVDFAQALLEVYMYLNHKILAGTQMVDLGSVNPAVVTADPTAGRPPLISPASVAGGKSTRRASVDDIDITHRENAKLLKQTLQLLFSSEVLVFAEFAEFSCSVVYGLYTITLYHMPYAKYNLSFIGLSEKQFWKSVGNTAVYCVLEGFTLLFLFTLMRGKYGISTLHQLAFVLEKYWMSVQGKMCGSLSLIFILNTVHHGTHRFLMNSFFPY
ncbi:hypothetical protein PHYSODRAFT_492011 [Phytophthora sojae]|uniref:Uncharacterized protein n=1 Tax=Phytophthora sojae (strain P6497) TaxID=1094619 RepID=G4Z3J5_PHYSP|nr:hypothetical protein PHYSODRAFT_492011 [Phytophthora sojae]EGZ19367.1 hypothetical protein PHYSODRAFT_492011 [Phytophthora sojae]|eukprot:XP_009522084.1 hypothetical protein PHYSODRAFT_492011 [Phytophthora sojae]